jgi:hypothetical protein
MTVDTIPLESSVLASASLRTESILRLTFNSDAVYDYIGVPEDLLERLRTAESAGSLFNEEIKDRYPFVRIDNLELKGHDDDFRIDPGG